MIEAISIFQLIFTAALLVVAIGLLKIAKQPRKQQLIKSAPDFFDTLNAEFPFDEFLKDDFSRISSNDAQAALAALHSGIVSAYKKHLQLKEKPCRNLQT